MVIEWRYNDEGQKMRVTTRYRIKRQVKKLKPEVIRRRSLRKFGDASHQVRGTEEVRNAVDENNGKKYDTTKQWDTE